jgi:hypothetical protein
MALRERIHPKTKVLAKKLKPYSSLPELSELEEREMTEQDIKELDEMENDFMKVVCSTKFVFSLPFIVLIFSLVLKMQT